MCTTHRTTIAWLVAHEGVHRDEVAVLERAQHLQPFLGVLTRVLVHRGEKRLRRAFEVRIVMDEPIAGVRRKCLAGPSGCGKLEERHRSLFLAHELRR